MKWVKSYKYRERENARDFFFDLLVVAFHRFTLGCYRFYVSRSTEVVKNVERMRGCISWQVATAQQLLC